MTKTWQTKKKIIKLVSKKAKTPGEISTELGLAPSTVSEHLDELERMGAVKPVENQFIKKWKYYRANPTFNAQAAPEPRRISNIQIAGALVIVLGLLALIIVGMPAASKGSQVVFSLTDPPSVPNGTQALNITYASLRAHYVGADNTSAWVTGTGSGTLDLMNLINTSQVIGSGSIPANATINMVSFNISSAEITVNGTTYPVIVPNGQLTSKVTGASKATANSSILIDLSPVVTTIFTQNSTVFVLVPSVKAVFVGNTPVPFRIGERHNLNNDEQNRISAATPAISISSASLTVTGNTTDVSVTVENNANRTIDLSHVTLYGIPSVMVREGENGSFGGNWIEANIQEKPRFPDFNTSANFSAGVPGLPYGNMTVNGSAEGKGFGMGMDIGQGEGMGMGGMQTINGVHVMIVGRGNASVPMPMLTPDNTKELDDLVRVGAQARMLGLLDFMVTSNGTLVLPSINVRCPCTGEGLRACPMCIIAGPEVGIFNRTGYELQAGATATLTYSGSILYADGHLTVTPTIGSKYELVVMGSEGAHAQTNVTVVSG